MSDPGGLFMFGAYGTAPTRETIALFRRTGATGLLLLARNIESPAQTRAFIEELEQRLGRPILSSVDHEGGWVLRFRAGMTAFPGNLALGRSGSTKDAYAVGRQMALELSALGIRMNLAPVLDVETGVYNPGIGMRSFGSNFSAAGRLGAAFSRGLQDHGVSACAKHFPGKGAATVDAHVDLPTIRLPRASFQRTHLAPFRAAVAAGVDAVMTSHVRFPAFDRVPATFSRHLVEGILRRQLGYQGLVISDDLCMGAIASRWPIAEATLKCLQAGHDVLMIAHDRQAMSDAVDLLREAGTPPSRIAASAARIDAILSARRGPVRRADPRAGLALSRRIASAAIRVVRRGGPSLPLSADSKTLIVIPDFEQVRERFTFEGGPTGPGKLIRRVAPKCARILAPVETSDLGALDQAASRADRVVFFCFEARRFPGQAAALAALGARWAKKTVAVLIRSPRDLDLCPKTMTVVDAGGYRLSSLEAALTAVLED